MKRKFPERGREKKCKIIHQNQFIYKFFFSLFYSFFGNFLSSWKIPAYSISIIFGKLNSNWLFNHFHFFLIFRTSYFFPVIFCSSDCHNIVTHKNFRIKGQKLQFLPWIPILALILIFVKKCAQVTFSIFFKIYSFQIENLHSK